MLCAPWLDLPGDESYYACCDLTVYEQEQVDRLNAVASSLLYMASGRQFPGECEATVRPCMGHGRAVQWVDYVASGGSRPIFPCPSRDTDEGCGCLAGGVVLPGDPIVAVTEVTIDGAVLSPTEYRLSGRTLLRVAGGWPCHQDLALEDTEARTWAVSYTHGQRPDPAGLAAAGALLCQLLESCDTGDTSGCEFPEPLAAMVREGVTFNFEDVESLNLGRSTRFGIDAVDRWLAAVNPAGLDRPGKWFSLATIDAEHT